MRCMLFFQGSIQGGDEFADGLARGIQSLLGHTIGKLSVFLGVKILIRLALKQKSLASCRKP